MLKYHPLRISQTGLLLSDALVSALEADGVNPDSYSPAYAGESVGLDLYNIGPDFTIPSAVSALDHLDLDSTEEMKNPSTWLDIPERLRKEVWKRFMPTGLKTVIPMGYVGLIKERGSVTKTPLKLRAGVIDPGYSGEIFVNMVNVSSVRYTIPSGAKSPFQLIITPVNTSFKRVDLELFEALHQSSARRTGMTGSSDK